METTNSPIEMIFPITASPLVTYWFNLAVSDDHWAWSFALVVRTYLCNLGTFPPPR